MEFLFQRVKDLEADIVSEQDPKKADIKRGFLADANRQLSAYCEAKLDADMKMAEKVADIEIKKRKADAELAILTGN
jgi:hypothetical protein